MPAGDGWLNYLERVAVVPADRDPFVAQFMGHDGQRFVGDDQFRHGF